MEKLLKKKKSSGDGKYHLMNFPRNWVHQALSYMDKGELIFRLVLEMGLAVFFYFGVRILGPDITVYAGLLIAFISAHTVNWLFNGNFWALYLFAIPHSTNRGKAATEKYLDAMARRLRMSRCIGGLALYGSAARGTWHSKSDLDIRVIREEGFLNLLCANVLVMRERIIAFLMRQPADLFLADGVEFLRKMREDEQPIFLIKKNSALEREYPDNREIAGIALNYQEKGK